tara:strand:- start:102 stop:317 length:216 start_codon:yes stop_codon:yes gene_type:complete
MADRYNLATPYKGKEGKTGWHRIGVAFPKKDGSGYVLKFNSLPVPVVGDDGSVETVVGMFEENEESRNRKN